MKDVGQHLLSGGLSGFASTIGLQPFDLLKTRIQQRDGKIDIRNVPGVFRLTKEILHNEGLTGLWRGTTASLFRNVPGIAFYMTGLTNLRAYMSTSPYFATLRVSPNGNVRHDSGSVLPKLSSQGNLLAGAVMRVGVGFVLNPFTVLKARYESNLYQYNSFSRAILSVVRGGPRDMLRGFIPAAISSGPYAGIFVACYEAIKRQTASLVPPTSTTSSTVIHTFSAASAGALATLTTHPFDLIKTKVQVRREDRYQGFLKTVMTVWQQRGALGFFDGISLRVSRKIVSSAVGWTVYEGLLMLWHNGKNSRTQRE